jgi:hypothetical protein
MLDLLSLFFKLILSFPMCYTNLNSLNASGDRDQHPRKPAIAMFLTIRIKQIIGQ